jgi:hypothetical protein
LTSLESDSGIVNHIPNYVDKQDSDVNEADNPRVDAESNNVRSLSLADTEGEPFESLRSDAQFLKIQSKAYMLFESCSALNATANVASGLKSDTSQSCDRYLSPGCSSISTNAMFSVLHNILSDLQIDLNDNSLCVASELTATLHGVYKYSDMVGYSSDDVISFAFSRNFLASQHVLFPLLDVSNESNKVNSDQQQVSPNRATSPVEHSMPAEQGGPGSLKLSSTAPQALFSSIDARANTQVLFTSFSDRMSMLEDAGQGSAEIFEVPLCESVSQSESRSQTFSFPVNISSRMDFLLRQILHAVHSKLAEAEASHAGKFEIDLEDAGLGMLRLQVRVVDQTLQLQLIYGSSEVQKLFRRAMPLLLRALETGHFDEAMISFGSEQFRLRNGTPVTRSALIGNELYSLSGSLNCRL